jgi:hypothetical protein
MNNLNENISDSELTGMLKKASKPLAGADFTHSVMEKVYQTENRAVSSNHYVRISLVFVVVAIFLALKAMSYLNLTIIAYNTFFNSIVPGLSGLIGYFIMILVTGVLLYELNLIVTFYYLKSSKKATINHFPNLTSTIQ